MHINNSPPSASTSDDARLNNLMGAFAVALADTIKRSSAQSTSLPEPLPAALIQIGSFSGSASDLLAKSLALSQSATTRVIQRLREKGLVSVGAASHDRRAIELKLSKLGQRQRTAALAARAEVIAAITSRLGSDEKTLLVNILERVFPVLVTDRSSADYTCRYCDAASCPQQCCPAEPDSDTWKSNLHQTAPNTCSKAKQRV